MRTRKRPRPCWKSSTAVSLPCIVGVAFCTARLGAAQFTDCLETLVENDANDDSVLSALDYEDAIFDMTQEWLLLDTNSSTRTPVHEAFDVRLDASLEGINIQGALPGALAANRREIELFCENIYQSLFVEFNVTVSDPDCSDNLSAYTSIDGEINATEFVALTTELSTENFSDFDELGDATQQVFEDFSGTSDVIQESVLITSTGLRDLFCGRIVLGTILDQTVADNSTSVPSSSPSEQDSSITFAPTLANDNSTETGAPTSSPSLAGPGEPTSPPGISDEDYQICTLSMLVSDRNRDDFLQDEEFVTFLNRQTGSSFLGESFQTLAPLFQTLFRDLRGEETFLDVFGSKPGTTPTAEQRNNLIRICTETERVYEEYIASIEFLPTTAPTNFPNVGDNAVSQAEVSQCKLFLYVSDTNRNGELDRNEFVSFVNRLTFNAFLGQQFSWLPFFFQDVFNDASDSTDTFSIVGAAPGSPVTPEQSEFLQIVCTDSYLAADEWEETKTETPTSSPTNSNNGVLPTSPPTVSAVDLIVCTTSLAVADANRDDLLANFEFVTFVNRMTGNRFQGLPFSSLDSRLQSLFLSYVSQQGWVDIGGARPGPRTEEQRTFLLRLCSEADGVIAALDQTGPTTGSPTVSPTGLTPQELAQCQAFVSVSDSDRDRLLSQQEFVSFVNELTEGAYEQASFLSLDPLFREAFESVRGENGAVSIFGSRFGESASSEQEELLETFCRLVFRALEDFNSRPPPTSAPTGGDPLDDPEILSCMSALDQTDLDANGGLDQLEYVVLVSEISAGLFSLGTLFEELPYIVQENFRWINGPSSLIDISGADNITQIDTTDSYTRRLGRICQRTVTVVSSAITGNNEVTPLGHCYGSMTFADIDNDNFLNETEFGNLISYYLGLANSGFSNLDVPYQRVFEENRASSSGTVNVEGSKPNQNPSPVQTILLEFLCGQLSVASEEARLNYQLYSDCLDALFEANSNLDDILNGEEYVSYVYAFAKRTRGTSSFSDLPSDLQQNFDALVSPGGSEINIVGWRARYLSSPQRENLDRVCRATRNAILIGFPLTESPTSSPSDVSSDLTDATVYNGFILTSSEGFTVVDLRNTDVVDLNNSYRTFVNQTILPILEGRFLRRRRKLSAVGLSFDSASVYQIVDSSCFDAPVSSDSICLAAYASFDVFLPQDADTDLVVAQYTEITQSAILGGSLQKIIESTGPASRFSVVGLTDSTRLETQTPTDSPIRSTIAPSTQVPPSSEDDSGSETGAIIVIAAVVLLICCCCGCVGCYVMYRRRKKKAVDNEAEGVSGDARTNKFGSGKTEQGKQTLPLKSGSKVSPERKGGSNLDTVPDENSGWDNRTSDSPQNNYADDNPWGSDGSATESPSENDASENNVENPPSSRVETVEDDNPWESESSGSPSQTDSMQEDDNPWGSESGADPSETHASEGDVENASAPRVETVHDSSEDSDFERPDFSPGGSSGTESAGQKADHRADEVDDNGDLHEESVESFEEEEEDSESSSQGELFRNPYAVQSGADDASVDDESVADTIHSSYMSMSSMQLKSQLQYRDEVKSLVAQVVPDEIEHVDTMMEQFFGREEELIATLKGMAKEVSKANDEDESYYSESEYEDDGGSDSDSQYEEEVVEDEEYADEESYQSESEYEEELEDSEVIEEDTINDDFLDDSFEGEEAYFNESFKDPNG